VNRVGRRPNFALAADRRDPPVLDDEGTAIDRRARVADDQARAFVDDGDCASPDVLDRPTTNATSSSFFIVRILRRGSLG
jgi:hypothetical protein